MNGLVIIPDNFTEHKSLTQIGVVPFSKICTAFAKLNETKETGSTIDCGLPSPHGVLSGDHRGISSGTCDGDSH